jgi:hypothetical protein
MQSIYTEFKAEHRYFGSNTLPVSKYSANMSWSSSNWQYYATFRTRKISLIKQQD